MKDYPPGPPNKIVMYGASPRQQKKVDVINQSNTEAWQKECKEWYEKNTPKPENKELEPVKYSAYIKKFSSLIIMIIDEPILDVKHSLKEAAKKMIDKL